jgi:hypothetical protein
MKLTEFSSGLTELLMYVIAEDEQTFSKASQEWGYYVPKATLSSRYPLLDGLVDGNVFITKLRRVYTHGEDTYDDITLMKAETRIHVEVWPYSGNLTKGYRQVFRARGGKPPYSWSCNNDSVGEIDADTGEFAAVGLGTCNVIAVDAEGITGSSGTITVGEEDESNQLDDDDDGGVRFSSCAMSSSGRNVGDISVLMMSILVIRLINRRKIRSH